MGPGLVRLASIVVPRIRGVRATPRRVVEPSGKGHRRNGGLPRGGAAGTSRTRGEVPIGPGPPRRDGTDDAHEALAYHRRLQELALLAAGIAEDHPALDRLNEVGRLCRSLGREREAHAWFAQLASARPRQRRGTRSRWEARRFMPTVGESRESRQGQGRS